ncbi:MAG: hypothetical protein A2939_00125 [Parcubacteria group bacterium RIFCSPLOWO2_01_FULL_48_18]|nr:MAG: hypothetical protein A3J67_05920 [Parcubacteria group bacterium RIFCSPHIGHO2_02_FULL_48_10b]OHB22173.1 MAG: hypothetical protein A2939_00125 [Parcubacteria group bacterium RIFCSPLOWO2_01_FULL_48_18]
MATQERFLDRYGPFQRRNTRLRSLEAMVGDANHFRNALLSARGRRLYTGTTIVALRFRDGVLMAGDRRASDHREHWDEEVKVHRVGPYSLLGAAGTVAYIQELIDAFDEQWTHLQRLVGEPIYIDGQAEIMMNILRENFKELALLAALMDYVAVPILAGWDPEDVEQPSIYTFDECGGRFEASETGYHTVGSGGIIARTILKDRWHEGMTEQEAVALSIRALYQAASIDLFTAPPELFPATVCVAKQNGVSSIDFQRALRIARKMYDDEEGRKRNPRWKRISTARSE